jgi:hypothetical protein
MHVCLVEVLLRAAALEKLIVVHLFKAFPACHEPQGQGLLLISQ